MLKMKLQELEGEKQTWETYRKGLEEKINGLTGQLQTANQEKSELAVKVSTCE